MENIVDLIILILLIYIVAKISNIETRLNREFNANKAPETAPQKVNPVAAQKTEVAKKAPQVPQVTQTPQTSQVPQTPRTALLATEENKDVQKVTEIPVREIVENTAAKTATSQDPQAQATKKAPSKNIDYENIIGGNIFSKIGVIVLILGFGFFIKLAIDNDWINETLRVVLSYVVGLTMIVLSQKLKQSYSRYSSVLAGGGFGIFYITTALAYHLHSFFSPTTALILLVLTATSMLTLSILTKRKELSIMGLVGGFIAPFILGSEAESYVPLLSYITILNITMFLISLKQRWPELLILSMAFSYIILSFITVAGEYDNNISIIIFTALTFILFFVANISVRLTPISKTYQQACSIAFIANNFVCLGIISASLYSLEMPSGTFALASLFIAATNMIGLLCAKFLLGDKVLESQRMIMQSAVISSLALAVPQYFSADITSLAWSLGMLSLLRNHLITKSKILGAFAVILLVLSVANNALHYSTDLKYLLVLSLCATIYLAGALLLNYYKNRAATPPTYYNAYNPILIALSALGYIFAISALAPTTVSVNTEFYIMFTFLNVLLLLMPLRYSPLRGIFPYIGFIGLMILYYFIHSDIIEDDIYVLVFLSCIMLCSLLRLAYPFIRGELYRLKENASSVVAYCLAFSLSFVAICVIWLHDKDVNTSWFVSIIVALIASIQVLLGFKHRFKLVRMIGIYGFGYVLAKLALYDLWQMSSLWKIVSLIVLGLVLLILSFIYQKQEKRKKEKNVDELGKSEKL